MIQHLYTGSYCQALAKYALIQCQRLCTWNLQRFHYCIPLNIFFSFNMQQ